MKNQQIGGLSFRRHVSYSTDVIEETSRRKEAENTIRRKSGKPSLSRDWFYFGRFDCRRFVGRRAGVILRLLFCGFSFFKRLAAALDKNMSLNDVRRSCLQLIRSTHLQGIFTREALVAVRARERLHGKMYPFMSLQIVIPIETLRAFVALEWSVCHLG
jgi:hypothetical protein